jgi:hypothetical protein
MVAGYIIYQAVGLTDRTSKTMVGHIQRGSRCQRMDTPPHGARTSESGAPRTRRDGTPSSKPGGPRTKPRVTAPDSPPSKPAGTPGAKPSVPHARTPRSTWWHRRTRTPPPRRSATSAYRGEARHASCQAVPPPHGLLCSLTSSAHVPYPERRPLPIPAPDLHDVNSRLAERAARIDRHNLLTFRSLSEAAAHAGERPMVHEST